MTNDSKDTAGVIAPPPLIYGAGLLLGYGLGRFVPPPFELGAWARDVGWVLVGLGVLVMLSGLWALHRASTPVNPYEPTTALVTDGPYRFSRNPLYIALTLVFTGLALMFGLMWALVLLPLVLWLMNRGVIAREEHYLERKFGQVYLDYKARVRRWL